MSRASVDTHDAVARTVRALIQSEHKAGASVENIMLALAQMTGAMAAGIIFERPDRKERIHALVDENICIGLTTLDRLTPRRES